MFRCVMKGLLQRVGKDLIKKATSGVQEVLIFCKGWPLNSRHECNWIAKTVFEKLIMGMLEDFLCFGYQKGTPSLFFITES